MRVVLPLPSGASASEARSYYVRVRSNVDPLNAQGLDDLNGGETNGAYRMQIRLGQVDEVSGSVVRYADIRYAVTGISVSGLPSRSVLLGESGDDESSTSGTNEGFDQAQDLGNLLSNDHNTISVGGRVASATDVDWYTFTLDYEDVTRITGVNSGAKTWATVFDIDYADGLGRGDLILSVFDSAGRLIYYGTDSDIEDDQAKPGTNDDSEDLSRGSAGLRDPYIGTIQLPEGTNQRYYVAVSSNAYVPEALQQFYEADVSTEQQLVRVEPVNSIARIIEDHIGFQGYYSGRPLSDWGIVDEDDYGNDEIGTVIDTYEQIDPVQEEGLFGDIGDAIELQSHVKPFELSDVTLFVSNASSLYTVDPLTGNREQVLFNNNLWSSSQRPVGDITMRTDGRLFSRESDHQTHPSDDNKAGYTVEVDAGTGVISGFGRTTVGSDNLPNYDGNDDSQAMAYHEYQNATSGGSVINYDLYFTVDGASGSYLYKANPTNGQADPPDQDGGVGLRGILAVPGDTTGLTFIGNRLFGVTNEGILFETDRNVSFIDVLADFGTSVPFSGLALGPQNLDYDGDGIGGDLANTLFACTSNRWLYAIDTEGNQITLFDTDQDGELESRASIISGATGLAFSPLDFNLWHATEARYADAGHGIETAPDNSRDSLGSFPHSNYTSNGYGQQIGDASFYFGLEEWTDTPQQDDVYLTYYRNRNEDSQYGVLTDDFQWKLTTEHDQPSRSAIYGETSASANGNYNLPGGAKGSLVTDGFSLSGYSQGDRPTLYFTYYLRTEQGSGVIGDPQMVDSARVLISRDGGTSWEELATNNSTYSVSPNLTGELNRGMSWTNDSDAPKRRIQELFDQDASTEWRQARVDLSDFAGQENLQIRFDFATAGTMNDLGLLDYNYQVENPDPIVMRTTMATP